MGSIRQGTSSQYQYCYLDLVIWYWSLFVSSTNSIQIVRRQWCLGKRSFKMLLVNFDQSENAEKVAFPGILATSQRKLLLISSIKIKLGEKKNVFIGRFLTPWCYFWASKSSSLIWQWYFVKKKWFKTLIPRVRNGPNILESHIGGSYHLHNKQLAMF